MWVLHTILGLAVIGLLGAAAWRLAGRTSGGEPPVRLLAALVWWWLAVQLAAFATHLPLPGEALRVGAFAVVAAGLVLWKVPAGERRPALDPRAGPLLAAVAVGTLLLVGLVLRRPALGFDALQYHLPLPAAWEGGGGLASLPTVIDGLPVEAYPVGMEQALGWLIRVSGTTAIASLLPVAAFGLLVVALWTMTRRLGGSVAAGWGAVGMVALSLPALAGAGAVGNDVLAVLLMAAGATVALDAVLGVREQRPGSIDGLLVGAVGLLLALGIKTTTACGVLVGLLLAWSVRRELWARLRERPLWLAPLLLALACGGAWLTRNLVLHGHPAWPLLASSFGDAVPPVLDVADARFAEHPGRAIDLGWDLYLKQAWPLVLLLPAALALLRPGLRRSWPRALALCGLVGAAAWTVAPATGNLADPATLVGATRYALPCWALLAVAAWSWPGERWRPWVAAAAALTVLAQIVLAYTTLKDIDDKLLRLPGDQTLIAVLAGAAVALEAATGPRLRAALLRPVVGVGALAVLAIGLLVATPGFWSRHAYAVESAAPPSSDRPILVQGSVPAWSLGAHGDPGAVVVDSCPELLRALAAGRVVAIGPGVPPAERCKLPGRPTVVDSFAVWVPGG